MKISPTTSLATIRALDRETFGDDMPLTDHQIGRCHWFVAQSGNRAVGFAGAYLKQPEGFGVIERYGSTRHGRGLGVDLLKRCAKWAKKEGARAVVTYTVMHNSPSNVCLLKAGFQPYKPIWEAQGYNVIYWWLAL